MSDNPAIIDRELGWEEVIERDSPPLLPEDDYSFTVTQFARERHNGSEKLPPCNKAVVSLLIDSPLGKTVIKHNLFLHSKTEGFLCSFFAAIGQRKKGERATMNWNAVVGATGRAHIYVDTWTKDNGDVVESNKVKKFLEPAEPVKGFEPGRF